MRLYVPRVRSGWHRMGTLSLSGVAWRVIVRPILLAGAERTGIRVTMEPALSDADTAPREEKATAPTTKLVKSGLG